MSMESKRESVVNSGQSVGTGGTAQLSLVAQFDDMCRFSNSLITVDEQELNELIRKCEENRITWLATKREIIEWRNKCRKLEEENKDLSSTLRHVRFGYGKEVQTREELLKQRNALRDQLNAIKDFVLSDQTQSYKNEETREKMLSYLNLNQLETIKEDTNESLDGVLEYDLSEENLLEESVPKRKSNNVESNTDIEVNSTDIEQLNDANGSGAHAVEPKAVFDEDLTTTAGDVIRDSIPGRTNFDRFGNMFQSSPQMNSNSIFSDSKGNVSLNPSLNERKHNLHQKKAFKSVICNPCGKTINFLGNFFCCENCRILCHIQCKARLPLPCIPFRKPNGKSSQMVFIGDFAPTTRPMIPALIYHCFSDIENRGLLEKGIYRKCGSDKEIRDLKQKIMKSKTGIPPLSQYDVHVVCGVVKQFLRELDEPIVTRILWRDFVRAADQEIEEEEKTIIMQTMEELPTANRDSLAFIMLHLLKVAKTDGNQMDVKALAKIFGPTIVGHSMIDPPMNEILAENPKQIKVMEALLRIPEEYWNGFLTATNTLDNRMNSPNRMSVNRRSVGTIRSGSLTPLTKSKGGLALKPLF